MMWYAHISHPTPSFPLLTYIHSSSSSIHDRYISYIIHVVYVSVFAYTCCLVWWLVSTIPIYIAYVLCSIVVVDIDRCVVHRCIVWCVVVVVSWRWVLISSFVVIVCVISSVLWSPSLLSSSSPLLPSSSSSPSPSLSIYTYFPATLSIYTAMCWWVGIVAGCPSVPPCTSSLLPPYQPYHYK